SVFGSVATFYIGAGAANDRSSASDFSIDELQLVRRAYLQSTDFENRIADAARDTLQDAFAIFHFEEYTGPVRSSVLRQSAHDDMPPMLLALDTNARLMETTSPVQVEQVVLTAEMISPTRVSIAWKTSTE